jgi:hypothetical protein
LVLKSSFAAVRTFGEADMAESTWRVIVITRYGRTTVISRWQAWVCGIGLLLAARCVFAFTVFVLVGVVVTVGAVLLLLIPAFPIVALVGWLMDAGQEQWASVTVPRCRACALALVSSAP